MRGDQSLYVFCFIPGRFFIKPARESARANEALAIPACIFRQRRLPAAGRDQPQAEAGSYNFVDDKKKSAPSPCPSCVPSAKQRWRIRPSAEWKRGKKSRAVSC